MRLLSLIIFTVIVVLGISFAMLNSESVVVRYYVGMQNMPLSILILITLVLGIGIGLLVSFPKMLRLKMEVRRLRRERG